MIPRDDWTGTWIDVVGDVLTRAVGDTVVALRVLDPHVYAWIWTATFLEPLMFHRMAVAPDGTIAVFGKGNVTGGAFLAISDGDTVRIGSTHGNNPCAIWHDGTQFQAVWIESPGVLARLGSDDGRPIAREIPAPWTDTSQGILDLTPAGSPIYMDAARTYDQPPWSFSKPNVRDGVRVGQWGISGHDETNRILVGLPGRTVFTAIADTADDPRVSVLPSGRILVGAYTPRGASLAIIDPPYPPNEQPPTIVPPIDPPIDLPPPAPSGTVTIATYSPSTIEEGGTVTATARITGQVIRVEWLTSSDGLTWTGVASVGASAQPALTFVFRFAVPGSYIIGLRGLGADGQVLDQTGMSRRVVVTAKVPIDPPVDPPPDPARVVPPPASAFTRPLVGVCWPQDPESRGVLDPHGLRSIRLLGLNALRFDVWSDNPNWLDLFEGVVQQDFWPIPITNIRKGGDFSSELARMLDTTEQLLRAAPWLPVLEVSNEPSGRMSADQYVAMVQEVQLLVAHLGHSCTVLVAAEAFDFGSGQAHAFWRDVKSQLGPIAAVAVHPYRNPKPWSWSAWSGGRRAEWDALQAATAPRIWITEVGWHNGEDQAVNTENEVDLLRSLGAEAIVFYAMAMLPGDFGIFIDVGGVWKPGPAAVALAHYLVEHPL